MNFQEGIPQMSKILEDDAIYSVTHKKIVYLVYGKDLVINGKTVAMRNFSQRGLVNVNRLYSGQEYPPKAFDEVPVRTFNLSEGKTLVIPDFHEIKDYRKTDGDGVPWTPVRHVGIEEVVQKILDDMLVIVIEAERNAEKAKGWWSRRRAAKLAALLRREYESCSKSGLRWAYYWADVPKPE
jgi:hypothetical protein